VHPNEVEGRIKALSILGALLRERGDSDWNHDDDRDAGILVRREPRYPNNAGGIALPEPDDDRALNLPDTEQHENLPIPQRTR
jgi:hypothetical protein